MNARRRDQRGFSLMEMMASLTVMLIIIVAIFSIIVAEQSTHLTEGRKLDMNQGARVIEQMLTEGFRSAGSVLTMANTPNMLGSPVIPFNGVYPLNNSTYPDGIILASGDPMALTRLTSPFPADDNTMVNIKQPVSGDWQHGDFGMIMRSDGYYVFLVDVVNAASLTVRAAPAYYSGLLLIPAVTGFPGYDDQCDVQLGTWGNVGPYPADSPVIRLEYFNIFLTRLETDGSKTLTLTTDCEGWADPFAHTRAMPILPNIEDIQIEYITKTVPPDIWAGSDGAHPGGTVDFYKQFYTKNIASARIYALLRTEEEKNKRKGSGITYSKPVMGDAAAATLEVGRYHYTYMQYEVLIRNYNLNSQL
jgi:prepilin-type N-terminal cleavage/methylation domain-containing protein